MAQKKDKSLKWLLLHGLVYGGVQILVVLPVMSKRLFCAALAVTLGHLVIDTAKFYYIRWRSKAKKLTLRISRNLFFSDQLLHGIFLVAVSYNLSSHGEILHGRYIINNFFLICGIQKSDVLSWALALLLIHKPVNIAIQKLLAVYRPQRRGGRVADKNAGCDQRFVY